MTSVQTVQQQFRTQFEAVEGTAQHSLRAWNEAMFATTQLAFSVAEQNLHVGEELRQQADRMMHESLGTYRRVYENGVQLWQGYLDNVDGIFRRSIAQ